MTAFDRLWSSKTFWTGVAGVASAGIGYATGGVSGGAAIGTGVAGLLGVFGRHAAAKIEEKLDKLINARAASS
jgi:hypothetical protein